MRCYAPEMHAAEVLVARELARLAAREPLPISGSRNRITGWINRNEMETGTTACMLHNVMWLTSGLQGLDDPSREFARDVGS